MANIIRGLIEFEDVVKGDKLDASFDISFSPTCPFTLATATFKAQVRKEMDAPVILEFKETDGTLVKTVSSATLVTLQFLQTTAVMALINTGVYEIDILVNSDTTIVKGNFEVVKRITK